MSPAQWAMLAELLAARRLVLHLAALAAIVPPGTPSNTATTHTRRTA